MGEGVCIVRLRETEVEGDRQRVFNTQYSEKISSMLATHSETLYLIPSFDTVK